ncbi:hypothetical protein QL285_081811 [Trifolium repens]|nr:hypothetical protein QL285_081811 [Trifolium repens]
MLSRILAMRRAIYNSHDRALILATSVSVSVVPVSTGWRVQCLVFPSLQAGACNVGCCRLWRPTLSFIVRDLLS